MARIPIGEELGNVVAEPMGFGRNRVPSSWAGTVGQSVQAIGADMQRTSELEAKQAARERDMAERAQAAHGLALGRVALAQVADQIDEDVRLGRVDKAEAETEWTRRAGEVVGDAVRGVPTGYDMAVKGDLDVESGKLVRQVRKSVSVRDMQDTRGGVLGIVEAAEREALVDRGHAIVKVAKTLATLGPAAGYGNDDQVRMLAQFREKAAFNAGSALLRDAREDEQALDATLERLRSDEFIDLAPEQLGQLETQVLGRKQFLQSREQTRIAQAQATAERRDREAEAGMKAAQTLIDSGAVPDDAFLAEVASKTAGTAYAPVLQQLVGQASERAGFAQLNPRQQQEQVLALRAKANAAGSNPVLEERIATFERIAVESQRQLESDPLVYGVNRRLIDEVRPLQFTAIDQLVPQLQQRVEQARTVAGRVRQPVSPLLAAEAEQVASMLHMLPVEQRTRAVRQLAKSVDTSMGQALAKQLSAKDPTLGLAVFASVNATGAPRDVAGLILRGADAVSSGRLKKAGDSEAARRDHARIAQELAEVPWTTTKARDAAVLASQTIYDGLRDERGGSANWSEAVTLATGGLTEWAGSRIPMPPGIEERQFRRSLERLDPKRLALQAGGDQVMVGGQSLAIDKLVSNMGAVKLIPAGPGMYALESGGQIVLTPAGAPLRIDVRN